MIVWHMIADYFLGGTFSFVNWIATYILMCVGSVVIEALAVRILWKISIKKLFLPMAVANIFSYLLLIFMILTNKMKI